MGSLGIYFGLKEITIVETAGKKVLTNIQIPQRASMGGELEDKAAADAKAIELVSLITSELKRNNISSKRATLCLSGKDLIVRTFEMAALPRQEQDTAIDFEIMKYLPFKADELKSDYQVEALKAARMNLILYVGIRNDTLNRYTAMFRQLNMEIGSVEYAGFSVLRAVKLAGLNEKGLKAVVVADVQAQDEVNFLVMDDGFPVFSRDISLVGGGAETAKGGEVSTASAVEKLKTEIRVSLDYFRRKFPNRNVQEVFFAVDTYHRQEIESFIAELGFSAKFLDIGKSIGKPVAYSSAFLKGFSASVSQAIKSPVKVNLLKGKAKGKGLGFKDMKPMAFEPSTLMESFSPRVVVLGALICAAAFGYGQYLKQPINKEIRDTVSQRVQVADVNPNSDDKSLAAVKSQYQEKINNLVNLVDKQVFVTELLSILPASMPEGVWLDDLSFTGGDKRSLQLSGLVYLPDEEKQMDAANKFLANLKQDYKLSQYFGEIKLISLDRAVLNEMNVLKFAVSCKSAQTESKGRRR